MDGFDLNKVKNLESDYSIFHPTITQMEIIYTLCDELAKRIKLDPFTVRQVFIKGMILHQQEAQIFHREIEENLPQIRLKRSLLIIDKILEVFAELLDNDSEFVYNKLKDELDLTIREYMELYVSRSVDSKEN